MIYNYLNSLVNLPLEECKILPLNWCASKFYTITFDGWKLQELLCEDPILNEMLQMASNSVSGLVNLYKDTHAFTEAQFYYQCHTNLFGIKIGTLEIEEYERRMNNEKKTDNDTL